MSRKAKYTKEVKLKSSKDYLSGEVSATNIARSLGMGKNGGDIVRDWARQYEMNGDKIYMTKGRITTLDERIEIVKWCLDHDRSIKDTAGHFGCSYAQIRSWVIKYEDFRFHDKD